MSPDAKTPTLGRLVEEEAKSAARLSKKSVQPDDFYAWVVDQRNDVVHRGMLPSADQAAIAFEVAMNLINAVTPREIMTEPYGLILART